MTSMTRDHTEQLDAEIRAELFAEQLAALDAENRETIFAMASGPYAGEFARRYLDCFPAARPDSAPDDGLLELISWLIIARESCGVEAVGHAYIIEQTVPQANYAVLVVRRHVAPSAPLVLERLLVPLGAARLGLRVSRVYELMFTNVSREELARETHFH